MAKTAFSPPPLAFTLLRLSSSLVVSPHEVLFRLPTLLSRERAARNGFFAAAATREQRVECNERIEFIYGGGMR